MTAAFKVSLLFVVHFCSLLTTSNIPTSAVATNNAVIKKPQRLSNIPISAVATDNAVIKKPLRLVTKLIHRDSIYSPYYVANESIYDRNKRAVASSFARLKYFTKSTNSVLITEDYRADVGPHGKASIFYVNISIGEPPVNEIVAMDTGGSLFWIQCLPCQKCFEQHYPIFDPSKSSTFANLSCSSSYCTSCVGNTCEYFADYLDSSISIGTLVTEKLTFKTSDGGTASVDDIFIGCGRFNQITNDFQGGVFGLGPGKDSLVSQMGPKVGFKFSHCLGSVYDPNYKFNYLIIGDDAKIEGHSTPMEIYNDHYYVTLEGISVGNKRLKIDRETFKRTPSGKGGVAMDSAAMLTFLAKAAYEPLRDEVHRLVNGRLKRANVGTKYDLVCYRGDPSRDMRWFPNIKFHFAGGVQLVLEPWSIFGITMISNSFCMTIGMTTDEIDPDLNIIGASAQQFYNIGYDLDVKKIYISHLECELLDQD